MFRFPKTLDIITLFSKAGSPASVRVAEALKRAATASAGENPNARELFELNVTEENPTEDQVKTILSYVGANGISSVIHGATTESEALKTYKLNPGAFQRPVVVDWNNGKAIASDNESSILKLLNMQK
ncbi:hypothetical protein TD95_001219 [Thielaviopsis punctulata]|uniref:Thioredoxin-like fold domain-containing protein n=1 Tax=Thielaviopsis punctulata TaxID=72032 RepID=A0A0F4ZBM2_9PEZI|nr:hypothetical protein TD95_001219 [Thielaviopsis punctulata]